MAMLREIDRKCQTPDCASAAVVEVLNDNYKTVGRHCRRDGNKALHEQTEKERNQPKAVEAKAV
jgi:hypothetical protein